MSTEKFGDLDLRDYLRIVGRPRGWRRTRAVVLAGTFFVAFVAGKYGPWPGKDSRNMSLYEAIAAVDRVPRADWEHENGVVAIGRHVRQAIAKLGGVAHGNDPEAGKAAQYAELELRNAALNIVRSLRQQAASGIRVDQNERYLEEIVKEVEGTGGR